MRDNSILRLGGLCAIFLGLARIASSALYLVLAPDLRAEVPAARFLPAFAQAPALLIGFFWIEILVGVLGLAAVPALSSLVSSLHEGWVRWTSTLASAGFIVSAVGYSQSIARLPAIAKAYVAGDAATQAALGAVWKASIDLFGLWGYGAVGLWVLVVSLLAMRLASFPKVPAYLGLLHAALFLLVPVGAIFKLSSLLNLVAGAGLIVGPIWWIWIGLTLRKSSS